MLVNNDKPAITAKLNICLILISGPPGTGKTSLMGKLKNQVNKSINGPHTITLSYDKIMDRKLEEELINANSSEWKTGRSIILTLTSLLISYFRDSADSLEGFEEYFKNRLDNNLNDSKLFTLLLENFLGCLKEDAIKPNLSSTEVLIFLDDIFYYESMRQIYYRLALNLQCTYFNFCLKPEDLDFLKYRNSNRPLEDRLTHGTIENIFQKFEYPYNIVWEKNFCHVQKVPEIAQSDLELGIILEGVVKFNNFLVKNKNENERLMISRCYGSVKSLVHECDLVLRKLITNCIADLETTDKSKKAIALSKAKAKVLNQLKNLKNKENCDFYFELSSFILRSDYEEFENMLRTKLFIA